MMTGVFTERTGLQVEIKKSNGHNQKIQIFLLFRKAFRNMEWFRCDRSRCTSESNINAAIFKTV